VHAPAAPDRSRIRLAIAAMLVGVLIFGSNFALSRHAILNGMTPADLVMLRFGTAGLVLLPLFLSRGGFATCAGVGWARGAGVTTMSGLPMTLLMMVGLSLAPAAHGASITPGTVMVVGAVASVVLLGAKARVALVAGIGIALAGLACIGLSSSTGDGTGVLTGDLLFLCAGMIWGLYPTMLQRWRIDGQHGRAVHARVRAVVSVVGIVEPLDAVVAGRPAARGQPGHPERGGRALAVGLGRDGDRRQRRGALSGARAGRGDRDGHTPSRRMAPAAAARGRRARRVGSRAFRKEMNLLRSPGG
jgi:drug/metabolite transporter (DMT)-like permease